MAMCQQPPLALGGSQGDVITPSPFAELDTPQHWRLKGEGNANLVFSYAGSLPHLVGKVLRVRKPPPRCAPEQQALEDAVWCATLGSSGCGGGSLAVSPSAAAAEREQCYVEQQLAPLLGRQYIPQQQRVQPHPAFLQQLLAASLHGSECAEAAAGAAVLMLDVTLLPGGSQAGGSTAAPPAAPMQLHAPAPEQSQGRQPHQQQRQEHPVQPTAACPVGPVVCVELKPKCGFITDCGTVHPDNAAVKRSRSRYRLHQLLKLAQGKVAQSSAYDPCDLFSGQPGRLRSALAALLDQPQNNLALFVDGRRQQLAGQYRRAKHGGGRRQHSGQQGERQREQAAAAPQASSSAFQQQPAAAQQEGQHAAEPAAALDDALAGLLPLPAGGRRREALVELLAAVLEQEELLPRLLHLQQQCQYDIEGVYRLYCQLAGIPPGQEAAAACAGGSGDGSEGGDSSGSAAELECAGEAADAAPSSSRDAAAASHADAVRRLLALPCSEAYAVLRSYVAATTGKDCAIMITLQRMSGPPAGIAGRAHMQQQQQQQREVEQQQQQQQQQHEVEQQQQLAQQHRQHERQQQHRQQEQERGRAQQEQQGWLDAAPACIFCPACHGGSTAGAAGGPGGEAGPPAGAWFWYRLALVDLDMKPLAKILAHHDLDRRILAAARHHGLGAGGSTQAAT